MGYDLERKDGFPGVGIVEGSNDETTLDMQGNGNTPVTTNDLEILKNIMTINVNKLLKEGK
ncbi:hypothetical protein K9L27_02975 [Candidatus Gracilibacteria bacterium]|nr:hypothetical protein [Candidatus Gracilibacteria bacterium]